MSVIRTMDRDVEAGRASGSDSDREGSDGEYNVKTESVTAF